MKTAHQLQAAHVLAGRTAEAAAMAQLVGRKMADITEAWLTQYTLNPESKSPSRALQLSNALLTAAAAFVKNANGCL